MRGRSSIPLGFIAGGLHLIHISPVAHFCLNKVSIPNKLNFSELMSPRDCNRLVCRGNDLTSPPNWTSREEPVL